MRCPSVPNHFKASEIIPQTREDWGERCLGVARATFSAPPGKRCRTLAAPIASPPNPPRSKAPAKPRQQPSAGRTMTLKNIALSDEGGIHSASIPEPLCLGGYASHDSALRHGTSTSTLKKWQSPSSPASTSVQGPDSSAAPRTW